MRGVSSFVKYVVEQLQTLEPVTKRIFGGDGIYVKGRLIGIIVKEVLYLHVGKTNRDAYVARGMAPFKPYPNVFDTETDHYQVPEDVVTDPEKLNAWALQSLETTIAAAREKQMAGIERVRRSRGRKKDDLSDEEEEAE
jgi:DNA transformation protein